MVMAWQRWSAIVMLLLAGPAMAAEPVRNGRKLVYPQTKQGDHVDEYHGQRIADPYRWLEDPDSEETKAWVASQNKVTFDYLAKIPQREAIEKRLTELW